MGYYKDEYLSSLEDDYEYIAAKERFWLELEEQEWQNKVKQEVFGFVYDYKKKGSKKAKIYGVSGAKRTNNSILRFPFKKIVKNK